MRSADRPSDDRSDASRRRHDSGFTLIEVLVAMAIVALAVGTASWALGPVRDRNAVMRALASFKAMAEVARERAVETGTVVDLSIDTRGRSLDILALSRSVPLPRDVDLTFETAERAIGRPQNRSDRAGILFFPDGTSTGGRLAARSGSAASTVRISWVSGASIDEP